MFDKHLSVSKITESSAYDESLLPTAPDISLTYIKNKRGSSIDPWGTPHEIFACTDRVPDTSTSVGLFNVNNGLKLLI